MTPGEALPDHERVEALQQEFEETGYSAEQAREISEDIVRHGVKYSFTDGPLDGGAFFNVRPVAGEIVIKLNINHPAYGHLVEALQTEISEDDSRDELAGRLTRANRGLRLLLMAWARYEDEEENPVRRETLQDIRTDWGSRGLTVHAGGKLVGIPARRRTRVLRSRGSQGDLARSAIHQGSTAASPTQGCQTGCSDYCRDALESAEVASGVSDLAAALWSTPIKILISDSSLRFMPSTTASMMTHTWDLRI